MTSKVHNRKNFRFAIIAGFAFLASLSLSAPSRAGSAAEGQKVFQEKCAMCHGADGTGNTAVGKSLNAADLHSDAVQKMTDAAISTQIESGKGNMPPFKGQLDKDQISDLIAYVRQFGKKGGRK